MELMKKRCFILYAVFLSIFTAILLWKLVDIQIFKSEELRTIANAQYDYKERLDDMTYMLLDNAGRNLLDYSYKYNIVVDPGALRISVQDPSISDMDKSKIDSVKYILRNFNKDLDLEKIINTSKNNKQYFEIDRETYDKIKLLGNVNGIYEYYYASIDRTGPWKIENLITSTSRTKDDTVKSPGSIEMNILDRIKNNQHSYIVFDKNVEGRIENEKILRPLNNINVKTTLDKNIQDSIKKVLSKYEYNKYPQIGVVLMESSTGNIKGMTLKDDNKPNVNLGSELMGFQPGSIFKVIVEESALENNLLSLNEEFTCKEGKDSLCKKPHGTLTAAEAFTVSCNNIFAQIGNKTGYDKFISLAKAQGLFDKVLGFDSEAKGNVEKYIRAEGGASRFSIGQSMVITPVQAIGIVNTAVNNGTYIRPRIIDCFESSKLEKIPYSDNIKRNVIKKSTADLIKSQMRDVVSKGTGSAAAIKGMEIGGKTGTNERSEVLEVNGRQETVKHSDGWFIGYFKQNGKYYSMVVFVMDIDVKSEAGGSTAAPIFKEVVEAVKGCL